jgi:hypothetical protein
MGKPVKFSAIIHDAGENTGGAYVLFPFDVQEVFGSKGRIPIVATIDSVPYRGSLVKHGNPQHMLPVLKGIREKTGKTIGDVVDITIERDMEKREVEVPKDFKKALKENKLEEKFMQMSYSHQREWMLWIEDAKKTETRVNRINKAMKKLKEKAAK